MNVIVTGASKGIGKAIAMIFAEAGHTLLLCARDSAVLAQTSREISALHPSATVQTFSADLSVRTGVEAFGSFCLQHGGPDILVNNAGVYMPGNCIDEPEGSLEAMMNTNLYSAYHLTRMLVPSMISKKSGHVFNICSVASLQSYEGSGGYSISKFAMNGFSQNLRHELMPHHIKVTAVFPGAVLTDSWGNYDNSSQRIMESGDIAKMVFAATQLTAQAVVEEITVRPQLGDL